MTITSLDRWVFRAPVENAVRNAFGAMSNRPALFLRITASDGAFGWGEVFCNFPQVGAEHRARLVSSIFAPLVAGMPDDDPATVRAQLETRTRRMAIQCGEPGPFAQIIGAIDQALWDLGARRAGVPLWRHLARPGEGVARVRVYASGIGPEGVVELARKRWQDGYRAFKLKVGFDPQVDRANLVALRDTLGPETPIMIDANQAWHPSDARARIAALADLRPTWVEEPLAADETLSDWSALARDCALPLAAGENLRGETEFHAAIDAGYLRFVQPDVGKWGGMTGCLAVARHALAKGVEVCPHWLAGGIGLAHSMHLRAALGEGGFVEVDANPNPLREDVLRLEVVDGFAALDDASGLGFEPDLAPLQEFLINV
ncbi:MAG: mandelate racemase/muconate lactonizing enzyme family protein [Burkholderiales bacterium]|nr:mandelate racemase/muconate lactonizing enzyme family protein [Burkholderiales bacterium]